MSIPSVESERCLTKPFPRVYSYDANYIDFQKMDTNSDGSLIVVLGETKFSNPLVISVYDELNTNYIE